MSDSNAQPAPWRIWTSLALCLFGLCVSGYLTWTHFAGVQSLSCPGGGGVINCEAVTTSAESYFPPGTGWVPVPILGLLFFVAMTALSLPMAWRTHDRRIHLVRLGMAGLGMVFALYLISVELVIVDKICIWCTTVHVITFFLFILVMSTTLPLIGFGAGEPDLAQDEAQDEDAEFDDAC